MTPSTKLWKLLEEDSMLALSFGCSKFFCCNKGMVQFQVMKADRYLAHPLNQQY